MKKQGEINCSASPTGTPGPLVFGTGTSEPHDVPLDISPHIDVSDDEGVEDDVPPDTRRPFPHLGNTVRLSIVSPARKQFYF